MVDGPTAAQGHRRILVLANETCASKRVCDEVLYRGGPGARVLVVAPALARTRMQHWLSSDVEGARAAAEARLETSVAALRAAGLDASGQLGDGDPMQALDDAYRVFAPDEVIVSTHPPDRSNWLERRVVQQARERVPVPVTHIVVDLEHEADLAQEDPRAAPTPSAHDGSARLVLYHAAPYDAALGVRQGGFRDERGVSGGRAGVLFVDRLQQADAGEAPVIFVLELPERLVAPYEVGVSDGSRRYVLPADLVNRHHPRELTSDWAE